MFLYLRFLRGYAHIGDITYIYIYIYKRGAILKFVHIADYDGLGQALVKNVVSIARLFENEMTNQIEDESGKYKESAM